MRDGADDARGPQWFAMPADGNRLIRYPQSMKRFVSERAPCGKLIAAGGHGVLDCTPFFREQVRVADIVTSFAYHSEVREQISETHIVMLTTPTTTAGTTWVYDSEDSPQAQQRLNRAPAPSTTPADPAAINLPMAGARGAALDRDIQHGAEQQRQRAGEQSARTRLEHLEQRPPVPFTREQLHQAAGVVDKHGTAYGPRRINGKTVTVTWDGCQRSAGLPCGRSGDLPVRGQLISFRQCQVKGITPRPAVASVGRSEVPSVMMTWAWCRSRSTAAVAKVLGMIVSNPAGWMFEVTARLRRS